MCKLFEPNNEVILFDDTNSTSLTQNFSNNIAMVSQQLVMDSVEELKKDKTIITIAHRLFTIENCDTIFFVDKGKIVDSGTHKDLLKNNKKYATLYNKQKKEKQSKKN